MEWNGEVVCLEENQDAESESQEGQIHCLPFTRICWSTALFSLLWSFSAAPFFFHSGNLLGQTCKVKQKQSPLQALLAHGQENVGTCLEASRVASGYDTLFAFLFVIGSCCPQSVLENSQSLTVISELVFSKTLSFDCPSILSNIEIKLSFLFFWKQLESLSRRYNCVFFKMSIKRNQAQFLKCISKTRKPL